MGNSQSGIAIEGNKNTDVEGSRSQPQSIRPASEVQPQKEAEVHPTCVKQTISHEHELILEEEGTFSSKNLSTDYKLHDHLHDGVFSNQMKEKLWVEKSSGKKCFMLFARGLSITWADTPTYWHWKKVKEAPRDELIEVVELVNVCWLEVHGKHEISRLSPETAYEILFVIMLKDPAYGWEVPVNFRLVLPDGTEQECPQNLMEMPRGRWMEISAGEIRTSVSGSSGTMEFSMYEYKGGHWKRGLIVKGVLIRPKK